MTHTIPDHPKDLHCRVEPIEKDVDPGQLAQSDTAILLVRGMGCPMCALRVRNGLLRIDGVLAADVVLQYGLARVWYQPEQIQPETLPALLPAFADDGRHHYTAHLLELSEDQSGGTYGTPV